VAPEGLIHVIIGFPFSVGLTTHTIQQSGQGPNTDVDPKTASPLGCASGQYVYVEGTLSHLSYTLVVCWCLGSFAQFR